VEEEVGGYETVPDFSIERSSTFLSEEPQILNAMIKISEGLGKSDIWLDLFLRLGLVFSFSLDISSESSVGLVASY
jgi:hypothetical protein